MHKYGSEAQVAVDDGTSIFLFQLNANVKKVSNVLHSVCLYVCVYIYIYLTVTDAPC